MKQKSSARFLLKEKAGVNESQMYVALGLESKVKQSQYIDKVVLGKMQQMEVNEAMEHGILN